MPVGLPRLTSPVRAAVIALGLLSAAFDAPASFASESGARKTYPKQAVICLAGCRGNRAPAVVALPPNVSALPLPKARSYDDELVISGVWCGKNGGCFTRGNIVPPRFYNQPSSPSFAVFRYYD